MFLERSCQGAVDPQPHRALTLGVGCGTLTSCGLAAATIAGTLLFGARLQDRQGVGLVVLLLGVVLVRSRL